jgi:selenium metabolism protein YedF
MGEGDPQLGMILMKGFINALIEQPVLPTHLIFYNAGVLLTTVDSGVIHSLKSLEESGIEILVCGTCVDFYDIKAQRAVGKISNMFTITETMAKSGHVVKP